MFLKYLYNFLTVKSHRSYSKILILINVQSIVSFKFLSIQMLLGGTVCQSHENTSIFMGIRA